MGRLTAEGLLAIEWTLIGIAFCLILARLNLRVSYRRSEFVLSDAFIVVAFAAGLSINAVDVRLHRRGIYDPSIDFRMTTWVAPEEDTVDVYRTLYIMYLPFYMEQYCNKGTLVALYYEIFGHGSRKIRISLALIVFYCVAGFVTTMSVILFHCKWGCYWSYTDACPIRCWQVSDNLGWAFHFTSEIFIFVLPLVCISRLNMSKAQKISASVTFAVGLVNIAITVARWFVVQAVFTPVPPLNTGAMAVADGHIGLIVSILPSLRPYLRIWQKSAESWRTKAGSSQDGTLLASPAVSTERTCSSKAEGRITLEELSLWLTETEVITTVLMMTCGNGSS